MLDHIILSKDELAFTTKLIEEAFANSAKAFSIFINMPVSISAIKVNEDLKNLEQIHNTELYSLLSELKGDVRGKCYLNFSKEDADNLFKICLSDNYCHSDNMRNAILLELDNILTAAVVTVLSNKLQMYSYAYVPTLSKLESKRMIEILNNDWVEDKLIFDFYTKFKILEHTITSEFIWVLESKFLNLIKKQLNH
jgi:chemotaxis protein CheY-P-specific phosphatase CheC